MCGIAGIVRDDLSSKDHQLIKQMADSLAHRGPDGEGFWSDDETIVLGHRRLCIIDPAGGSQPMHYQDRYTILFNGAIYNYIELRNLLIKKGHSFHSNSDTEVLLALYADLKDACLALLDGMFAFVVFDRIEKTLFCARDRFGEKPFYFYFKESESFLFGSEMKALWAAEIPRTVKQSMLYNYFMFGYVENVEDKKETFFNDIQKLPPAHYCIVDCRNVTLTIQKYWDINWHKQSAAISINDAKEQFSYLFEESVKKRLRSDVSLGSSLSGGLDSSAVVSMINLIDKSSSVKKRRSTFSARFPGYEKDETSFQELVNEKFETQGHATFPSEDSLMRDLDRIMYHQEEPFHSASIVAQYEVYKLAVENNVTVLLDGQGADEILGGYTQYYKPFFRELYSKNKNAFTDEYKHYMEISSHPQGLDLRFRLEASMPSQLLESIAHKAKQWKYRHVHDDLEYNFKRANKTKAINYYNNPSTLNQALYSACTKTGLETLLRYADRNSMAHGREVRLPFLNHELVEFVFSLPAQFKIHNGWSKYLLRLAVENYLPQEITWRKDKTGFEPPQKKWMQTKIMQDAMRHYKEVLVEHKILKQETLSQNPTALAADEKGDNSWQYFMAGKLLEM